MELSKKGGGAVLKRVQSSESNAGGGGNTLVHQRKGSPAGTYVLGATFCKSACFLVDKAGEITFIDRGLYPADGRPLTDLLPPTATADTVVIQNAGMGSSNVTLTCYEYFI